MRTVYHLAKMTSAAGLENHLLTLLPGLRSQGIDAALIVLVEPDKPMTAYVAEAARRGIPTETMTIQRDLDLGLIRRLSQRFRQQKVDAVHTHLIHADLHGLVAAKLAGIPRLYSSGHNDDRFRRLLPVRMFQAVLWRQVTAGIAISEALRQFMLQVEFAPAAKIHTVHYGLDPTLLPQQTHNQEALRSDLNLSTSKPLFGSVCRLVSQKGLTYALQAFARVANEFDAHYAIVGDGPLRTSLMEECTTLGITDRVHFLGWRNDAQTLYPSFDAFIMPSLWEGFGLVALEAMASSLPTLASRVSALPEIVVDGETGYLAAPASVDELAARMRDLLQNADIARQMGEAGKRRLQTEFSVEKMVAGTRRVYGI
jgi:glycosyltransferase involved in cell wall biosynthesis